MLKHRSFLLLQEELPDTSAELEAEIELLEGWLQQTHQLLALKGFPIEEADGNGRWPESKAPTSRPRPDVHSSGPHHTATAKPVRDHGVNRQPGPQTAQEHTQDLEADAVVGTERSLGAIDAALRAQGFR